MDKIAGFTKEQWIEALTQETTEWLWGEAYKFIPIVCSNKVGDGEQLIWVESMDMRPCHWLVFIDSKADLDEIDIEEFLLPLEEDFGRHPHSDGVAFEDEDDFKEYLKDTEDLERNYDTYKEYLSACEYPAVLFEGGSWGLVANFLTGKYKRGWLSTVEKYFKTKQN
jgi:hypothetical protein